MARNFTSLTAGSLERINRGEDVPCPIVVQVLGIKRIPSSNPGGQDRYRLVLTDGVDTHNFAMLAIPLNSMYEDGQLTEFTIVRIDRFVPSKVNRNDNNERQVLIVFEMSPLHPGHEVGTKIESTKPAPKAYNAPAPQAQKENYSGNSNNYSSINQNSSKANMSMNASASEELSGHLTMPIDSLSPYQNKWVIKARVMSKSGIRTWSNAKGEGKLFTMDLCDETGEIRCTGFRDLVDRYYEMIEVDKVYYISKCQLKPANKQYSQLKNDYEMTMNSDTQIQPCIEEYSSIPKLKYDLVTITDLAGKAPDSVIDVIGICKEAGPVQTFTSRANKELTKREVTLIDQSNASISLTLWGNEAQNFNDFDNPVVFLKGAKLGEYNGGKTLGALQSTVIKINPDLPEGHRLRGWFENGGSDGNFVTLSTRSGGGNVSTEFSTFHEAKLKNMGAEKPEYFQIMGMIHTIRSENMMYKACPNGECNKKVVDLNNGTYRCDKCNIETSEYKNRLLVNMMIGDWTSNRWVTFFSELGEKILEKKTDEIAQLMEGDKKEAEAFIQSALFKPKIYKLRTKVETYGDVPRNKISAIAVGETKIRDYNQYLLKNIRSLTGIEKVESKE
ncbi:hypothetical protein ACKWTF_012683 [Chironomus riparius]